jgi:hypothetical protein
MKKMPSPTSYRPSVLLTTGIAPIPYSSLEGVGCENGTHVNCTHGGQKESIVGCPSVRATPLVPDWRTNGYPSYWVPARHESNGVEGRFPATPSVNCRSWSEV